MSVRQGFKRRVQLRPSHCYGMDGVFLQMVRSCRRIYIYKGSRFLLHCVAHRRIRQMKFLPPFSCLKLNMRYSEISNRKGIE